MREYKGVKYSDIYDCISDRGDAGMEDPDVVAIFINRGEPGIWAIYMDFTYKDINDKKHSYDEFNKMIDDAVKDWVDNERWNDNKEEVEVKDKASEK